MVTLRYRRFDCNAHFFVCATICHIAKGVFSRYKRDHVFLPFCAGQINPLTPNARETVVLPFDLSRMKWPRAPSSRRCLKTGIQDKKSHPYGWLFLFLAFERQTSSLSLEKDAELKEYSGYIKSLFVNKTFVLASDFWPALAVSQSQNPHRSAATTAASESALTCSMVTTKPDSKSSAIPETFIYEQALSQCR